MTDPNYCDRCDMTNCEHTTGAGERFDKSMKETYDYFEGYPNTPPRPNLTHQGKGPTIAAKFNGWCKGCGQPYDAGTQIVHSRDHDGWVAPCCAG